MYYAIVFCLMFAFPAASVLLEHGPPSNATPWLPLIGKWFVFWAVGVRLLLAGLRQIITPRFTAEHIFNLKSDDALVIVRELGFANCAIGTVALLSLHYTGWTGAAAIAGGLFYGLAGLAHLMAGHRNRLENVAMMSDLFVFAVLVLYSVGLTFRR